MTHEQGLYLHIPFCERKCAYCDFASFSHQEDKIHPVLLKMQEDIKRAADTYKDSVLSTLYIGGGTPSIVPPKWMDSLLSTVHSCFTLKENAELSCEMNPSSVTDEFLDVLKHNKINRLSMGIQSSKENILHVLSRIHTFDDAVHTVHKIKAHGFHNFNVDMMLGIPTQTLQDVKDTVKAFVDLDPTHISCYGLIVEENTRMHQDIEKGVLCLPDEQEERAMYYTAREMLQNAGYLQYEISNFSKKGYMCQHNVDCWQRKEYIGIGLSACGFTQNVRYQNACTIKQYLENTQPTLTYISQKDAMFESIMLGLRLTQGVSLAQFEQMHHVSLESVYLERLKKPLKEQLVTLQNGYLTLTQKGMDMQNAVLVELMD